MMVGFPRFFKKCSRCSRVAAEILVSPKIVNAAPGSPATTATNLSNGAPIVNVGIKSRVRPLENGIARNKYLCGYAATTATPDLFSVATVATVATDEPAYERGQDRIILTRDQVLAIPLRSCLDCRQFAIARAHCTFYDAVLPEPTRICRCRHHRPRGPAH